MWAGRRERERATEIAPSVLSRAHRVSWRSSFFGGCTVSPHDPFGQCPAPPPVADEQAELEQAVGHLLAFAEAVIEGREPSREDTLFTASGLDAWLRDGGDLVRDFWRARGRRGSHHSSPQSVARRIRERRGSSR